MERLSFIEYADQVIRLFKLHHSFCSQKKMGLTRRRKTQSLQSSSGERIHSQIQDFSVSRNFQLRLMNFCCPQLCSSAWWGLLRSQPCPGSLSFIHWGLRWDGERRLRKASPCIRGSHLQVWSFSRRTRRILESLGGKFLLGHRTVVALRRDWRGWQRHL